MRSWHTKDGGIMSEMPLSMRAPSVVPRYAVAVGSLKLVQRGTAIGKTREERGKFNLEFTPHPLVEEEKLLSPPPSGND